MSCSCGEPPVRPSEAAHWSHTGTVMGITLSCLHPINHLPKKRESNVDLVPISSVKVKF